ncbi:hypothetical protein [Pseudomonas paracarnis]|uniref:hypothetical protein n=1 Tax=Pseudomonas paracarnis TaxID=2750625 RepID=UPI001C6F920D|nr:hypothetical protein [Pseudomonas paracarnis]MBW9244238.1 hypothetical protein [Pseudomonas paracarnis]
MAMNFGGRLIVWCGCFGLFVAGVVWSSIFYDLKISFLKDVVEVCSYVATIIAAGAAVATLSAWRRQWKYSAAQDALKRLTNSLDDLSCAKSYLRVYGAYQFSLSTNPASEHTKTYRDLEEQLHLELKQASKDFVSSLQDVHLLFENVKFEGFLSDTAILSREIIKATDALRAASNAPGAQYDIVVALSITHESYLHGLMFEAKKRVEVMRKDQLSGSS